MTGNSHDVEIELFDNSFDDEYDNGNGQSNTVCYGDSRSPSQDLPEDFRSCTETLTPRHSAELNNTEDECRSPNENNSSKKSNPSLASPSSATPSSQTENSSATVRPIRSSGQEGMKDSNDEKQSKGKHLMADEQRATPKPSIEISMAEDSSPDSASSKTTKVFDPIYVGGLNAIREVDSDSARSPTLGSPTVPAPAVVPKKMQSRGSITLLDRFGRNVWLHRNEEQEMDEVRVDEDGIYYVFGQGGFRVRLKEGQIQSENTSQPFCISNGKKVNINIVADRLRTSALQDPRPEDDTPITPRTEPIATTQNSPLPSPLRNITRPPPNPRAATHKPRLQHSKTPWTDLLTGVAEKSKHATTYLTKGARSKMRSSAAQPVQPIQQIQTRQQQQQSTSRISSRASSANKSGLETGNSREAQGRRLSFLRQGARGTPVANIRKRIMSRRQ